MSVEPILNVLVHVYLIYYLISILLQGSRENDDLIVLGHKLNELDAARPHKEEAVLAILDVVDECLV